MRHTISIILGGGKGTRLLPLTEKRSKPAVPIGGKYRLIDVPISNCLHSSLNRIYVLTQFNSVSLHRHIRQTYSFDVFSGGFVEVLPAQQTLDRETWYQGTADAVRKQLRFLKEPGIRYVLILSGDQLAQVEGTTDGATASGTLTLDVSGQELIIDWTATDGGGTLDGAFSGEGSFKVGGNPIPTTYEGAFIATY